MKKSLPNNGTSCIVLLMEHIDTIKADTIEPGDMIEVWTEDDSEGKYVIETVVSVEDGVGDTVEVYTEETPEGVGLPHWQDVRIFAY